MDRSEAWVRFYCSYDGKHAPKESGEYADQDLAEYDKRFPIQKPIELRFKNNE
jgi:hypothetical protein